jgi:hypothetical protein
MRNAKHQPRSTFRISHSALTQLALFLALSIAWTWPLVTRISWRIPHDPGDPTLNTWILWWNTQAVPFSAAWWNAPFFFPMPGAFALSEHLAGVAIFTVPLHLAGLNPLAAYNVALILSGWLSGYFAFLLGRRLTGSTAAGLIAGCAFALAPYRAGQLSHLQVLTSQWMPLALLGMHRYLDEARPRWLVLFAVAWLLQALSNGYYLLFFPVLIAVWLAWFVDWRANRRRGLVLVATFAAASTLLIPTLLRYKAVHEDLGLSRTVEEMVRFSASPGSLLQPARLLTFWPTRDSESQEGFLFPGVTVVTLVAVGLVAILRRRSLREAIAGRSPAIFYGVAALLFWWLSFGPAEDPSLSGVLRHPYTLLTWLPGFEGLRAPARFGMIAVLCISLAAALAWARTAPGRRLPRSAAVLLVFAGLFVDGWIDSMPLGAPPPRLRIEAPADAVVIELPTDDPAANVAAMYRAISHRLPLVNGYSGHTPPHYVLLSRALREGDPSILSFFARGRTLIAVVHRNADENGDWRALVERAGGVLQDEFGLGPVYAIPPQPRRRHPPLGQQLSVTPVRTEDGYVGVDLGSERVVRALRIPLRWRHEEIGPRLGVETSTDGVVWTAVWEDWTGEAELSAALEDQLMVPMTIYLPDLTARYIRLTAPEWVANEIAVFAPR